MADTKSGRILIVDDEIDVLVPLRDFLTELGYEVTGYVSAKEALAALKEEDFDLLLTDLVLPEMDGISLLKSARKAAPNLTCIVITGQGTIESAVEAMKVGAFDYITKPVDWKVLRPMVSRAIEVTRLRKSEEKYRSIVEDQAEFICRWRPDGIITFVNEVICRYFGISCDELIGSTWERFLPPEDYEELKKRVAILNKENPVAFMEHRAILPTGEIRWQQWSNRAIFDEQGRIVEFQSVGHDITDRKRAEEALKESENLYRTIFETTGTAIVIDDEDTKILLANIEYEKLTGHSKEDLEGKKSWTEFVVKDDLDSILEYHRLRRIDPEAAPRNYEFRLIDRNGSVKYIFATVSLIPGTKKSLGSLLDITKRKQAEENLKISHEQLRALSKRLSQAEEKERKRIARELHDQVGQNLTALGINLNMLRVRLSDILTREIDSRLNDSLNLLEETVAKIRDVMTDLRPSVLDDYGLMAAIRWYSEQFSNRTGVEIAVDGRELKPRLPSEVEITLFRIVQELLTNVAKHAMASRVTLSLVEKGEKVSLTIADNGIGFDPIISGRSGRERGCGLLNIRERAESIGGKLTVESKPGQGTHVEIDIRR